jgi:hypothetical protein
VYWRTTIANASSISELHQPDIPPIFFHSFHAHINFNLSAHVSSAQLDVAMFVGAIAEVFAVTLVVEGCCGPKPAGGIEFLTGVVCDAHGT